jgi:metallophosphoesterase superfamily enzyme
MPGCISVTSRRKSRSWRNRGPSASGGGAGRRERGRPSAVFATDGKRLIMPSFGVMTGGLDLRHKAFAGLFEKTHSDAHMLGQGRIHTFAYHALRG